ncbi:MAG TPA: ion channel [Nocardioidaceae bacterium]|nr:ion channel [Nocardioidaceae bacterium]
MRRDADAAYRQLPDHVRRRLAIGSLLRSVAVSLVILVGYFTVPVSRDPQGPTLVGLLLGIGVVALVFVLQLRAITRSPYPRVRAMGAVMTSAPLFLAVFASTYYLLERASPGSFSEPLTRLDALYLTLTTFATVGYGDITGVTQTARALTMVQMVGNIILVGLIARLLVNAVETGLARQQGSEENG